LANRFADVVNVKDFGAIGNGVADDKVALQNALNAGAGGMVFIPNGTYIISDTIYIPPATTVFGESAGDNWATSSSELGTRIKTTGTGTLRVWTDIGLAATPAGTLVDAPISVAIVLNGSSITIKNITLEGGTDVSNAWGTGFFFPCVKRSTLVNVETEGKFLISGCYIDATWSNLNTALLNLHSSVYGVTINSDTGMNETLLQDCYLRGGNWGIYAKYTDRTDTSANIWGWGGVSDLVGVSTRFGNDPIGTAPNFPESSGAYYRDVGTFQNRFWYGCSFRTSTAYSVFLDRGTRENFIGCYGEAQAANCQTQSVTYTVDALGVQKLIVSNQIYRKVYLTNTSRIDVIATNTRPGAQLTSGLLTMEAIAYGFDSINNRAYFITLDTSSDSLISGDVLSQAAGQTTSNQFYATERATATIGMGAISFQQATFENIYFGSDFVSLRSNNFQVHQSSITGTNLSLGAEDEVHVNCENGTQVNLYTNRYDGVLQKRLRFTGAAWVPYNAQDLGESARKWTNIYATNGTIITSDENYKQQIQPIEDAVLRAWGKVEFMKFKMNDAVAKKGNAARWHIGVIAQRIKEAFESEGIDAFEYGILCYSEWDDEYENIKDDDGNIIEVRKTLSAGNAYSVRYDEALALECAYLRGKLNL
jgi:hypothetical protein